MRKVYLILATQLALTVILTAINMYCPQLTYWQAENYWLFYVAMGIFIVTEIAIFCNKNVARTSPINYICLLIFTLAMTYLVSFICAAVGQTTKGTQIVFIAVGMTFGLTLALTVYAMVTKDDFTMRGGALCSLLAALIMIGIMSIFFYSMFLEIIYCSLAIFVYGLYLVYDTQLIMGGKRWELDYDDYILGAMMLYIDIIILFLRILELLLILFKK